MDNDSIFNFLQMKTDNIRRRVNILIFLIVASICAMAYIVYSNNLLDLKSNEYNINNEYTIQSKLVIDSLNTVNSKLIYANDSLNLKLTKFSEAVDSINNILVVTEVKNRNIKKKLDDKLKYINNQSTNNDILDINKYINKYETETDSNINNTVLIKQ